MKNKRLEERRAKISKDIDIFVEDSFDIADRIHKILTTQGKEQKDLAKLLGKEESEISKWMTGTHNFTIRTLSKISAVLGEKIIQIAKVEKEEKEEKEDNRQWIIIESNSGIIYSSNKNQINLNIDTISNKSSWIKYPKTSSQLKTTIENPYQELEPSLS